MAVISTTSCSIPGVGGACKRIVFTYSADTTDVIAGVSGQTIKVFGMMIAASNTSQISWDDGSTVLFGPLAVGALFNLIIPPTSVILCATSSGGGLDLALSATDTTTGSLWYQQS